MCISTRDASEGHDDGLSTHLLTCFSHFFLSIPITFCFFFKCIIRSGFTVSTKTAVFYAGSRLCVGTGSCCALLFSPALPGRKARSFTRGHLLTKKHVISVT